MSDLHRVIQYPYLTEKSSGVAEGEKQQVAFKVAVNADKIIIRRAVEQLFNVKVESVRVMAVRGKLKRLGRFVGRRPSWKKAIVTLAEGSVINLYEGR